MAGDDERLLLMVEARVNDLEKQMRKGSDTVGREFGKMRRDSKSATHQMENDMRRSTTRMNQYLSGTTLQIGAMARAFAGGLVGGIVAGGVAGIVGQIRQVSRGIAEIGDEARRAGVSAQAFQEWRFVAEQNRIGIDAMVDGLKELNLRADEFVDTGAGAGAEAFQTLGYNAEELQRKLKDPSALLLEIIDRLGKLDKASQIRVADEIFGGSAGERFVELIEQGEEGIRATIDQAHDLGVIMNDDLIESAAELDRKFSAVATTVSTGLKTAIVESAEALQDFINTFQSMWERYEQRRKTWELGAAVGSVPGGGKIPGADDDDGPTTRTTPKTGRLPKAEWVPPTPPPGGFGSTRSGRGANTRDRAAAAAEREAEKVRELISELERELSLVGATDLDRETSNVLRQAGASATAEQKAQIVSLVTALHAEEEAQRKATDAAAEYRYMAEGVLYDLRSALSDGKLEWEELADVAVRALDRIIDKMMTDMLDAIFTVNKQAGAGGSGGGILGFLGGMFGGGSSLFPKAPGGAAFSGFGGGLYATGTANTGGVRGEPRGIVHGQEAVIPLPNGGKVPVQVSGMGGGGGGETRVKVDVGVTVDRDGNLQAFVRNVAQEEGKTAAAETVRQNNQAMQNFRQNGGNW